MHVADSNSQKFIENNAQQFKRNIERRKLRLKWDRAIALRLA